MVSMVALKQALDSSQAFGGSTQYVDRLKMELGDRGLAARWEAS